MKRKQLYVFHVRGFHPDGDSKSGTSAQLKHQVVRKVTNLTRTEAENLIYEEKSLSGNKLKFRWNARFEVGHSLNISWQGSVNLQALLNKLPLYHYCSR